jgi:hypothetical protein
MRLAALLACSALVVVAGCGADSPEPEAEPTVTGTTPAPTITGRVAMDPDAQFISFRRGGAATYGGGAALITGTLRAVDGCLVLQPGNQPVAFDADYARFDGTTLVLEPVAPGDPVVQVKIGEEVRFGGGYGEAAEARTSPTVSVPRACAALGAAEVAYVEDW